MLPEVRDVVHPPKAAVLARAHWRTWRSGSHNGAASCRLAITYLVHLEDVLPVANLGEHEARPLDHEDVKAAWIEGWLDDSEIWVSGRLEEYSMLGRRGDEFPT